MTVFFQYLLYLDQIEWKKYAVLNLKYTCFFCVTPGSSTKVEIVKIIYSLAQSSLTAGGCHGTVVVRWTAGQ